MKSKKKKDVHGEMRFMVIGIGQSQCLQICKGLRSVVVMLGQTISSIKESLRRLNCISSKNWYIHYSEVIVLFVVSSCTVAYAQFWLLFLCSCRSGLLKLWVIVELASPDPSGSDSDLGLAPGGRVKLVKSASVNLASSLTRQVQRSVSMCCVDIMIRGCGFCRVPPIAAGLMQAHCLQFRPRDTNHIYVGTDTVS